MPIFTENYYMYKCWVGILRNKGDNHVMGIPIAVNLAEMREKDMF